MKRLFLFLCLLAAMTSGAQTGSITYTGAAAGNYGWKGLIGGDSGIFVRPVDNLGTGRLTGHIKYKTDGSAWMWNGTTWLSAGGATDTSGLSARINQRVKYTDTAAMLAPYLRSSTAASTYLTSSSSLNASNLLSGTIPPSRYAANSIDVTKITALGSPSSSTFLRGDGSWQSVGSGLAPGYALRTTAWNITVDSSYRTLIMNTDTPVYVSAATNGLHGYLKIRADSGNILKMYTTIDTICYENNSTGTSLFYVSNWGDGTLYKRHDDNWSAVSCPSPSVSRFYMTTFFNSFDTTAGPVNTFLNQEELAADTASDNAIKTAGTADYIYVYNPATGKTNLRAQAWGYTGTGYTFNLLGPLVDSTMPSGFFPVGIVKLRVSTPMLLAKHTVVSIGWAGSTGMHEVNPSWATFSFATSTAITDTPLDWWHGTAAGVGSTNQLGNHVKLVLEGH